MAVHIGQELARVLEERGMNRSTFAERVGRDRSRIHELFDKASIDTQLLLKCCRVLGHNFFRTLSEDFEPAAPEASEPAPGYGKVRQPIRIVIEADPMDAQALEKAEALSRELLGRPPKKKR